MDFVTLKNGDTPTFLYVPTVLSKYKNWKRLYAAYNHTALALTAYLERTNM